MHTCLSCRCTCWHSKSLATCCYVKGMDFCATRSCRFAHWCVAIQEVQLALQLLCCTRLLVCLVRAAVFVTGTIVILLTTLPRDPCAGLVTAAHQACLYVAPLPDGHIVSPQWLASLPSSSMSNHSHNRGGAEHRRAVMVFSLARSCAGMPVIAKMYHSVITFVNCD